MRLILPWIFVANVALGCAGDDAFSTGGTAGSSGGAAGVVEAGEGGGGSGTGGNMGAGGNSDASGSVDASVDTSADGAEAPSEPPLDGLVALDSFTDAPAGDSEPVESSIADSSDAGRSPRVCAETCTVDDDCARDSGIQPFRCHPETHHCSTCVDDTICVATRSFWTAKPCSVDLDCVNEGGFSPFGDVCIDVGGSGYCAFLATSTMSCTSVLNTPSFSTFRERKFGSGDPVDVCGKPSRCDADRGSCQNPCTSNTSCTPARGGKVCNVAIGRCQCG